MSVLEIYHEARCKHCAYTKSLGRGKNNGTRCTLRVTEPKTLTKIREATRITLMDKACENFKL